MPIKPGVLDAATIGNAHQLKINRRDGERDGEFSTLIFVDLRLVNLDVGLAQLAGRDDHYSTMILGLPCRMLQGTYLKTHVFQIAKYPGWNCDYTGSVYARNRTGIDQPAMSAGNV